MAIMVGKIQIQSPVLHLGNLTSGRTFVCGDIHGCFSLLEQRLKEINFNHVSDRLICVGDLIDRGPESVRALEFLAKPWFYSVLGNHELMLLDVLHGDLSMEAAWLYEGGAWFYEQVPEPERGRWKERLSLLPVIIEVETEAGMVGIVHADIPDGLSWQQFTDMIHENEQMTLAAALKGRSSVAGRRTREISGVNRIYCGHSYVKEPLLLGNLCCIDTGAYLKEGKGRLTLLEVSGES